jgi:hypothetical protein
MYGEKIVAINGPCYLVRHDRLSGSGLPGLHRYYWMMRGGKWGQHHVCEPTFNDRVRIHWEGYQEMNGLDPKAATRVRTYKDREHLASAYAKRHMKSLGGGWFQFARGRRVQGLVHVHLILARMGIACEREGIRFMVEPKGGESCQI